MLGSQVSETEFLVKLFFLKKDNFTKNFVSETLVRAAFY